MKKLFIICTLMMPVLAASAGKAKKTKSWQPDYRLEQAFVNRFGDIGNVTWVMVSDILTSASFVDTGISDRPVKAYFDNKALYMGMTQQTTIANMPERLAGRVRKFIDSYTVMDVIEYWYDGGSAYYIKVINRNESKLVKASLNDGPKFVKAGE